MSTVGKIWMIFNADTKQQTKPLSLAQAQNAIISINPADYHKFFLWSPGWKEWVSIKKFMQTEQQFFQVIMPPNPMNITVEDPGNDLGSTETKAGTSSGAGTGTNYRFSDELTQTKTHFESAYTEILIGDSESSEQPHHFYQQDFNGNDLDLHKIEKNAITKKAPKTGTKKSSGGAERRQQTRHNFQIEIILVSATSTFKSYSQNISLSGTMLEDEIPKEFVGKQFDLIIINPFEMDPRKARLLFKAKIVGDFMDSRRLSFFEAEPKMKDQLNALLMAYMTYQKNIRKGA